MATLDALLASIHSDPPNALEAAISFFEHSPSALVLTGGGTVIEALLRQAHTIGRANPELAFSLASTAACLSEYENFEATPQAEKDRLAAAAFAAMGAVCAHGFRDGSKAQTKHMTEAFTVSQQYFGGRHYNDSFVEGSTTGLRHAPAPSPGEVVSPAQRFWRRTGCATGIAALLLLFQLFHAMGVIKLPFKLPWDYDYEGRYATNHAYDNLGKDAKGYTAVVRAFKGRHPYIYANMAKDIRYLPAEYNPPWGINTDEAQRLIRANINILRMHNPYVTPKPQPGWITQEQAVAIFRQQADPPKPEPPAPTPTPVFDPSFLGTDPQQLTQLIRAFKQKDPTAFNKVIALYEGNQSIMTVLQVRNVVQSAVFQSQGLSNSENSKNPRWLLYKALDNIITYATRHPAPYVSANQVRELFLAER
jgi:hypothetical protein